MSEQPEIRKGLNGVVADYTEVSKVNPETNSLLYRGYPVHELANNVSFEEVAMLLWNGELPNEEELQEFYDAARSRRVLDEELIGVIEAMPKDCHPMDVLRTAVSFLGTRDPEKFTPDSDHIRDIALTLLAKLPTIVALDIRRRRGEGYIEPDPAKGYAENFL